MTRGRLVEHPADSWAVDGLMVNAKADDASRVLVKHHHDRVRPEDDGLAPKKVDAPQAILRVTQGT